MTLFNYSYTLLGTVKHLLFCFFCLFSINAYSAIAPDVSESLQLTLKARVTDTYVWSDELNKYSLQNSQFTFKVLKAGENTDSELNNVIDQGGVTDISSTATRYLSVSSNQVRFESIEEGKQKKRMILKAQLSDSKEQLLVYLSEKRKGDILSGLLVAADVKFDLQNGQQNSSSDYSCGIKDKKLICTIDYLSVASAEIENLSLTSQKIN